MKFPAIVLIVLAALLLGGCASNPYAPWYQPSARYDAYEHYKPTPVEMAQLRATYDHQIKMAEAISQANADERDEARAAGRRPVLQRVPRIASDNIRVNPYLAYQVTDCDAVNYADHVRTIFTAKFTNARFSRYTSSTVQVVLAASAGVAAAFSGGTAVIAGLAFGSAVTPEIGKIFNAKGRAEIYRACALRIDFALNDYARVHSGTPSMKVLTPEGRALIVQAYLAIEAAEKGLSDELPGIKTAEEAAIGSGTVGEQLAALKKKSDDLEKKLEAGLPAGPGRSSSL